MFFYFLKKYLLNSKQKIWFEPSLRHTSVKWVLPKMQLPAGEGVKSQFDRPKNTLVSIEEGGLIGKKDPCPVAFSIRIENHDGIPQNSIMLWLLICS